MALLQEPLTESSIKILFFSGRPDDYLVWKSKQLAKAGRYGYLDLILGETALPSDSDRRAAKAVEEDKRTKPQLDVIENWRLACRGYEDLILAMNTATPEGLVAWAIVNRSRTTANAQGDVKLAFDQLEEKYAPPTAPNYIILNRSFVNAVFDPVTADPETFLREMEELSNRGNAIKIDGKSDTTEMDLVLTILSKIPQKMYAIEIHQIKNDIANKNKVTIETLRTQLQNGYNRINSEQLQAGGTDEQALAAIREEFSDAELVAFVRNSGNFKGNCRRCGVQGHKGVDCPNNGKASGGNNNSNYGGNGSNGNNTRSNSGYNSNSGVCVLDLRSQAALLNYAILAMPEPPSREPVATVT